MMRLFSFLSLCLLSLALSAQYAPRDNWAGSTAMPSDSSVFIGWGSSAEVVRGPLDIRNPQLGNTDGGTSELSLGQPDGQVVSLGDGGSASLQFNPPIVDGPGADFAVFENGFHIRSNSDSDFLEFAFVEVSSDGLRWVRFASLSDNDTLQQIGSFTGSRAHKVHNLAGKYVGNFGTPFDLSELKDSLGIDVMEIRYVRVVDVVGSLLDSLATRDSRGYKINDPFPTAFAQGGFDLDGIGVIYNQHSPNGIEEQNAFHPYPNPSKAGQGIRLAADGENFSWAIFSSTGQKVATGETAIAGENLPVGSYFIETQTGQQRRVIKWIVR